MKFVLDVNCQASTFEVKPVNQCFVLGGEETDVQFNCTVNYGTPLDIATLWRREDMQITSNEIVTDQFVNEYEIVDEYNLVIKNVEISDASNYWCLNSLSGVGEIKVIVYLIVLGNQFFLEIN